MSLATIYMLIKESELSFLHFVQLRKLVYYRFWEDKYGE